MVYHRRQPRHRCRDREAALAAGDRVVATGRKAEAVGEALADADAGDQLMEAALDVAEPDQAAAVVRDAVARFGRIDVFVNNAGYGQLGYFETLSRAQIERQYATNVFGLFDVTRAVLPQMRSQRAGHILNISSIGGVVGVVGVVGFGGVCGYTSSKFAVEGFSEDMAIDLKPFGIKATIVEPGFFRTDFLDSSSVMYGEVEVTDYVEIDREQREHYSAHSHQQLGDSAKLGATLVRIVAEEETPLRLAMGSDAVRMTREALERRLAELDRWRSLSETTDHQNAPQEKVA